MVALLFQQELAEKIRAIELPALLLLLARGRSRIALEVQISVFAGY